VDRGGINDPEFGAFVSAERPSIPPGNGLAVDHLEIEVFFVEPETGRESRGVGGRAHN
jgi:hypothetical protein